MFLTPPIPFGLDISDLSIKFVSFKKKSLTTKGGGLILAAFGDIPVPEGYFDKGEIKEMEKIADLIKKSLKKPARGKITSPYVISVLPETKSFIKLIELSISNSDFEKIPDLVKEEIRKDVPISLENSYLDWQIISPDTKNNKFIILAAVAPKNIVDNYTLLLKKAGLKPLAFEIESVAITRSLIDFKEIKNNPAVAIIDLGASRSSVIIFDSGTIQHTSTIPISGNEITNTLASILKTPPAEAEKLKIVCGLNNKKCKKIIDETIQPIIETLVNKIQEIINFYQNQANRKINKILLCGGGANLNGLDSFLYQKLKVEIKKGNPWINTSLKIPPLSLSASLGYTTAIGLALRGVFSKD